MWLIMFDRFIGPNNISSSIIQTSTFNTTQTKRHYLFCPSNLNTFTLKPTISVRWNSPGIESFNSVDRLMCFSWNVKSPFDQIWSCLLWHSIFSEKDPGDYGLYSQVVASYFSLSFMQVSEKIRVHQPFYRIFSRHRICIRRKQLVKHNEQLAPLKIEEEKIS